MSGPFMIESYRKWRVQEHFVRNYYDLESLVNRRYRVPMVFFIPVLYPLSRICDALNGNHEGGLILALKARKCKRHTVGAPA